MMNEKILFTWAFSNFYLCLSCRLLQRDHRPRRRACQWLAGRSGQRLFPGLQLANFNGHSLSRKFPVSNCFTKVFFHRKKLFVQLLFIPACFSWDFAGRRRHHRGTRNSLCRQHFEVLRGGHVHYPVLRDLLPILGWLYTFFVRTAKSQVVDRSLFWSIDWLMEGAFIWMKVLFVCRAFVCGTAMVIIATFLYGYEAPPSPALMKSRSDNVLSP